MSDFKATALSGSLTKLTDGTSYLIAGANTTITSGSNGSVTIASTGGAAANAFSIFAVSGQSNVEADSGTDTLTFAAAGGMTITTDASGDEITFSSADTTYTVSTGLILSGTEISINDAIVATISGSTFTGATSHNLGLSGSLTQLTDGTSYLIAGSNITITSSSNGSITISSDGGSDSDWTDGGQKLLTTSSVSIDSDGSYVETFGSDVFFAVSGSQDGKGTEGVSLFGGDMVISGAIHSGRLISLEDQNSYVKVALNNVEIHSDELVKIQHRSGEENTGSDTNFFVSGSIGSIGTSTKGASVFGGDVLLSGSLIAINNGKDGATISGSIHHTQDGLSYLVAGTNTTITSGTNGQITISSTAGGSQNVFQTIAVAGQSNVVADSTTDTLTFSESGGMTITTDASTDTVTFSSSDTTYTAGDGLDLTSTEFSLDLKSSGGLKIDSTELAVEPNDFAGTGLEDDGSDNLRIATTAAGTGLTGGGGSALSLDINGLSADTNAGNLLDSIAISDNSDSNAVKKITLTQLQTLIDTDTTYSTATSSTSGLIKIEDDTTQSVAANAVSSTASRTYGIQLNSSGQAVVNVPWSDTNTQTESFKTVTLDGSGAGTQSGDANIIADSSTDTLTFTAGSNIDLSGTASSDTITISTYDLQTELLHYAEYSSAPSAPPVASGTDSIAIGENSLAAGNNQFVAGLNLTASAGYSSAVRTVDTIFGSNNKIYGYGAGSNIGGGYNNEISGSTYSVIAGGVSNEIEGNTFEAAQADSNDTSLYHFIGGGSNNRITLSTATTPSWYSALVGGFRNSISSSAGSFLGGGQDNSIGSNETAYYAVLCGGINNEIGSYNVRANYGSILGGRQNQISHDYVSLIGNYLTSSAHYEVQIGFGENSPQAGSVVLTGSLVTAGDTLKVNGGLGGSISGSIHHTNEGISYIKSAGTSISGLTDLQESINIVSESNGQIGVQLKGNVYAEQIFLAQRLEHAGDSNTYIDFTDDDITFRAGGVTFLDLNEGTSDSIVFNEGGVDVDFRIESDGLTHAFYIDGFKDQVIVGSSQEGYNNDGDVLFGVNGSHSGGFISSFYNSATSNTTDCIALKINRASGDQATSNSYIDFLDSSNTVLGRARSNGSGGITYSTAFTGQHPTSIVLSSETVEGMIVESTGETWLRNNSNMETGIPKVSLTNTNSSKKVFGVIASLTGSFPGMSNNSNINDNETHIDVNSLGEGLVWVTNLNGNVENGDYVVSSTIPGYGQKQSDDIMRNSTVAKCTENIDWDNVTDTINHEGVDYKKYLSLCTYHCG